MTKQDLKGLDSNSPLTYDPATNFQIVDMWRNHKNNDDTEQYKKIQQLESNLKELSIKFLALNRVVESISDRNADNTKKLSELEKPRNSLEFRLAPETKVETNEPKQSPAWSQLLKKLLP